MKRYFLHLLLFVAAGATAQKTVDLDKFYFTAQFRSLPAVKLDSSYRTYAVSVSTSRLIDPYLADLEPERSVRLDGWKQIDGIGHLSIAVKLGDLLPQAVSVKQRVEEIKNKTGQITSTRTYYWQEVQYSFEAVANIDDYRGIHIMQEILADRAYRQLYKSPEFPIRGLAEGYFVLNAGTITKDLFRNCVTRAMRALSRKLTENFGFEEITVKDHMWIVDSRKHPEYDAHRKAFKDMSQVIFGMSASVPLGNAKEKLKPAIDYFETVKKKYSSSSKHDRKIRYASFYNLAVLYYYLDDPESMMKEATGLVLNDFDANDGKQFERTALWLKKQFEVSQFSTRHFSIDPSAFKGPQERKTAGTKKSK